MRSGRDVYGAGRDLYLNIGTRVGEPGTAGTPPTPAYDRNRPLFIQYLNPEILSCYGLRSARTHSRRVLLDALEATRFALLLTDTHLIFPASYVFEVPCFSDFLREIAPVVRAGNVGYIAPVVDLDAYREIKAEEYRQDPASPYSGRVPRAGRRDLAWKPRLTRTTAEDISSEWHRALEDDGELREVVRTLSARRPHGGFVEKALHSVPTRIQGQAIIGRIVREAIPIELTTREATRINMMLSKSYLLSYLIEFRANMVFDFSHAELSCGLVNDGGHPEFMLLSARMLGVALDWMGLRDYVLHVADWDALMALRAMPEFGELVAVLYAASPVGALRAAVVRTRRVVELGQAMTLAQAMRNVSAVASNVC